MKRIVNLPKIKVEAFITYLVDNNVSTIYHVYIDDKFYRACGSYDEVNLLLAMVIHDELAEVRI